MWSSTPSKTNNLLEACKQHWQKKTKQNLTSIKGKPNHSENRQHLFLLVFFSPLAKSISLYWPSDGPIPLACIYIISVRMYELSLFPFPRQRCKKQNGNTCFLLTHTQTLQNKKYELPPSSCVCALNMCKHWTECRHSKAALEKMFSFFSLHPPPLFSSVRFKRRAFSSGTQGASSKSRYLQYPKSCFLELGS